MTAYVFFNGVGISEGVAYAGFVAVLFAADGSLVPAQNTWDGTYGGSLPTTGTREDLLAAVSAELTTVFDIQGELTLVVL